MRLAWERLCAKQIKVTPSASPGTSAVVPAQALELDLGGSRLCAADRERMVKSFDKNYPGVVLHPGVLPAVGYLGNIQSHCFSKSWAWSPWRKILSKEAAMEAQFRKAFSQKKEWDLDIFGCPQCSSQSMPAPHSSGPRLFHVRRRWSSVQLGGVCEHVCCLLLSSPCSRISAADFL